MDITVTGLWASPSTLHLRLMVQGKRKSWVRFANVHVPLSEIPSEVRSLIALSDGFDREHKDDPLPLDGL